MEGVLDLLPRGPRVAPSQVGPRVLGDAGKCVRERDEELDLEVVDERIARLRRQRRATGRRSDGRGGHDEPDGERAEHDERGERRERSKRADQHLLSLGAVDG